MNRINVIILILLFNPTFILMFKKRFRSLKRNEYFLDTCCSFEENDQMTISCPLNEQIRLKLIEIYYNSNEYCSSEYSCCKYRTKCSRRITKYSTFNCDGKNVCSISKTCLKISDPCSNLNGYYGQYMTIEYSCLSTNGIVNQTNIFEDEDQPVPFIVKLSTSDQIDDRSSVNEKSFFKNFVVENDLKSSPIFLMLIIFVFLLFLILTYWLADQIGRKICRKKSSKKVSRMSTEILLDHSSEEKTKVQSNPSLTMTRIYPSHSNSYSNHPYSYQQRYLTVHQHPFNGQFYSRTFYPYFNY